MRWMRVPVAFSLLVILSVSVGTPFVAAAWGDPVCFNGVCEEGEDCTTCSADCGLCSECGDDYCTEGFEDVSSCPADCGSCGDGEITADEVCDPPNEQGGCAENEYCGPTCTECRPLPSCGDGVCNYGAENARTCPADCPASCGDRSCTHTEDWASCPQDCAATDADNDGAPDAVDACPAKAGAFCRGCPPPSCGTCEQEDCGPDGGRCIAAPDGTACTERDCVGDCVIEERVVGACLAGVCQDPGCTPLPAGTLCHGGQCQDGACLPVEGCAGLLCDGSCIDPFTDDDHCGACGNACAALAGCIEGVCVADCSVACASDADCSDGRLCYDPGTCRAQCVRVMPVPATIPQELGAALGLDDDELADQAAQTADFVRIGVSSEQLGEQTLVTLALQPSRSLEEVRVPVSIPKCMAEHVKDLQLSGAYEIVLEDPLIVWTFATLDTPTTITLSTAHDLDADCEAQLAAMALADLGPGLAPWLVLLLIPLVAAVILFFQRYQPEETPMSEQEFKRVARQEGHSEQEAAAAWHEYKKGFGK